MSDDSKGMVLTFVYINSIMITAETITQILHYILTDWANDKIKEIGLMFLLIRPVFHFFSFFLYFIFHWESVLTIFKKLITLILHIFSVYIGFTPWVHMSFFSKYYLESENGVVIAKIVNGFCFIFVSLPKLILIPINSSAVNKWKGIDIVAIIFSILYIIFSIIYYIYCGRYDFEFEVELEDMSKIWELDLVATTQDNDEKDKINESINKEKEINKKDEEIAPNQINLDINNSEINKREKNYENYINIQKQIDQENESKRRKELTLLKQAKNVELNEISDKDKDTGNENGTTVENNNNVDKDVENSQNIDKNVNTK